MESRPRSNHRYSQTVIGDCGHPCQGWPLLTGIGGSLPHTVICDTCTREQYGIDSDTAIGVWVRVAQPEKPEKKPPLKRAKKSSPKPNTPGYWDQFFK